MTGMALRLLIFVVIALAIWLGARKIWRDWQGAFKQQDDETRRLRRERDLRERQQPGVIDLKRGDDGTFRPNQDGRDDKR